jgi:signal transduction histidine kinase
MGTSGPAAPDDEPAQRPVLTDRHAIARVLHDRILTLLTGAALQLRVSIEVAGEPLDVRAEHLDIAEQTVQRVQQELRTLIESLRHDGAAPSVSVPRLVGRLADVRNSIAVAWQTSMDVRVTGSPEPLSADLVEHTVDIVQETAANAARHGGASQISVDVDLRPDSVALSVMDNGRGFEMYGQYDLFGLVELDAGPAVVRERVGALGGSLVLRSTPEGSRLEIEYPKPSRD